MPHIVEKLFRGFMRFGVLPCLFIIIAALTFGNTFLDLSTSSGQFISATIKVYGFFIGSVLLFLLNIIVQRHYRRRDALETLLANLEGGAEFVDRGLRKHALWCVRSDIDIHSRDKEIAPAMELLKKIGLPLRGDSLYAYLRRGSDAKPRAA